MERYNKILRLEEEFWKLKSKVNWISEEDRNTTFFHTTTLNERRHNRILALLDDYGSWIYDQEGIL